jgi:probable F420-dependent oxidoreductase
MPMFGAHLYVTQHSMDPVELVKAAEERGLDSVNYPEHTHIPTSRKTPFPGEGDLPKFYAELHDPFIVMAAAASVTRRIKLGTGVCLIPERDPLVLAKQVASLDVICKGRLFLGIGAGWNAEEMENHGTRLKTRWQVTRERILAMKQIWSNAEAEFHGRFVNFDPVWSWPKPVQSGGPPVLLGSASPTAVDRAMDFCDGWYPPGFLSDFEYYKSGVTRLHEWAARTGRRLDEVHLSTQLGEVEKPERARRLLEAGFRHVLFSIFPAPADKTLSLLDRYAEFAQTLRREFGGASQGVGSRA